MDNLNNNKKSNSVLIVFLIVITFGLILGGYYLWQKDIENEEEMIEPIKTVELSSNDPTIVTPTTKNDSSSGWLTYNNDNFGYTISYPKEYKLSDSCFNSQTGKYDEYLESPKWLVIIDKNMDYNFPYCESDFPQMELMVKSFDNEIDINEMMEQSDTDIEDTAQIGDNAWARQIMTEPSEFDGEYSTYLFLNKDGKGYEIDIKNTDSDGTHEKIIDEIIGTLSFN